MYKSYSKKSKMKQALFQSTIHSAHKHSLIFNICMTTLGDFKLYSYKIQTVQALKLTDRTSLLEFCSSFLNVLKVIEQLWNNLSSLMKPTFIYQNIQVNRIVITGEIYNL